MKLSLLHRKQKHREPPVVFDEGDDGQLDTILDGATEGTKPKKKHKFSFRRRKAEKEDVPAGTTAVAAEDAAEPASIQSAAPVIGNEQESQEIDSVVIAEQDNATIAASAAAAVAASSSVEREEATKPAKRPKKRMALMGKRRMLRLRRPTKARKVQVRAIVIEEEPEVPSVKPSPPCDTTVTSVIDEGHDKAAAEAEPEWNAIESFVLFYSCTPGDKENVDNDDNNNPLKNEFCCGSSEEPTREAPPLPIDISATTSVEVLLQETAYEQAPRDQCFLIKSKLKNGVRAKTNKKETKQKHGKGSGRDRSTTKDVPQLEVPSAPEAPEMAAE